MSRESENFEQWLEKLLSVFEIRRLQSTGDAALAEITFLIHAEVIKKLLIPSDLSTT